MFVALSISIFYNSISNAYVLNQQYVGYDCYYDISSNAQQYSRNLHYSKRWNFSGSRVYVSYRPGYGGTNIFQTFKIEIGVIMESLIIILLVILK